MLHAIDQEDETMDHLLDLRLCLCRHGKFGLSFHAADLAAGLAHGL